jgi:hypothetical protein
MKTGGEYYDPDEDVRPSSPGLVPTQINYKPQETPPPSILSSSSSARSASSEIDDSRDDLSMRKKKRRTRPSQGDALSSQGDALLISYLDPNRPDIAQEVAQRALNSASQSEAGDDGDYNGSTKKDRSESANATKLTSTARAALNDVAIYSLPQNHHLNGDYAIQKANPATLSVRTTKSIITSPALVRYHISAAQANPDSTLPPMQTATHSPDRLPALKTALITVGPSPSVYSHPSPSSSKDMASMSPPSHSSFWRITPIEALPPINCYPTPKNIASPDSIITPQIVNSALSANGPLSSKPHKCDYPGCTASPFQTQYLLNSHANVHSSSRPHYCPVKTCLRSMDGKGFKRKNEMIRHGLVHDSPGYVCPFCSGQQHKYPRPDNLQR